MKVDVEPDSAKDRILENKTDTGLSELPDEEMR